MYTTESNFTQALLDEHIVSHRNVCTFIKFCMYKTENYN